MSEESFYVIRDAGTENERFAEFVSMRGDRADFVDWTADAIDATKWPKRYYTAILAFYKNDRRITLHRSLTEPR